MSGLLAGSACRAKSQPCSRAMGTCRRYEGGIAMSVESEAAQHFLQQRLMRTICALAAMLILAGCTTLPRTPYTSADAASARVLNLGGLRRYADEPALAFLKDTRARYRADGGPLTYLALS